MIAPSEPGIRKCISCGWLFVSLDKKRIRRCSDCKQQEDNYQPIIANISQVAHAIGFHFSQDN